MILACFFCPHSLFLCACFLSPILMLLACPCHPFPYLVQTSCLLHLPFPYPVSTTIGLPHHPIPYPVHTTIVLPRASCTTSFHIWFILSLSFPCCPFPHPVCTSVSHPTPFHIQFILSSSFPCCPFPIQFAPWSPTPPLSISSSHCHCA